MKRELQVARESCELTCMRVYGTTGSISFSSSIINRMAELSYKTFLCNYCNSIGLRTCFINRTSLRPEIVCDILFLYNQRQNKREEM